MTEAEALLKIADALRLIAGNLGTISVLLFLFLIAKKMG
jgi:hypothetical protein